MKKIRRWAGFCCIALAFAAHAQHYSKH